jgi:serpin B
MICKHPIRLFIGLMSIAFLLVHANPSWAAATPSNPLANALGQANNRFAFKLFPKLTEKKKKNIFISPASISIALAMTYNGASDKTRQAIKNTLELQDLSFDEINKQFAQLTSSLKQTDVRLTIANSLWGRKDIEFKKPFLETNQKVFDASIRALDFAEPSSKDIINAWVDRHTKGKIPEIVDKVDSSTVLFLINAIYFKGQWTERFDKAHTKPADFTLAAGDKKSLPFMNQFGDFHFLKAPTFKAVRLPYGKGRFGLYIFLPNKGTTLESFLKTLSQENWKEWMTQFRKQDGYVSLPRFKLKYDVELSSALKAMGMALAFDATKADFAAMVPPPLRVMISQVKHKTFMEINEEGTEAAAATSVEMVMTSASVQKPFKFVVDRPFFCAIHDSENDMILFMGAIFDPS